MLDAACHPSRWLVEQAEAATNQQVGSGHAEHQGDADRLGINHLAKRLVDVGMSRRASQ